MDALSVIEYGVLLKSMKHWIYPNLASKHAWISAMVFARSVFRGVRTLFIDIRKAMAILNASIEMTTAITTTACLNLCAVTPL